jgi:hypothetical protein
VTRQDAKAGKGRPGKEKKAKKGSKGGAAAAVDDGGIRIGAHPRARRSVRKARAWAGMVGFAAVLLLAMHAGVPAFEAVLRALAGGIVLHFAAWAFAITLWRRLIVAELEIARERLRGEAAAPPGV